MLQRNGKPIKTHAFLTAVEIEEGVDIMEVTNKLVGSVTWMEGVGDVDCEHLGEIDVLPEEEESLDTLPSDEDTFLEGSVMLKKEEMN